MAEVNIGGTFHSTAEGNVVARANEIQDNTNYPDDPKKQSEINEDILTRTGELEEAVGTGGSVDERIATAKSEVIGDAATDYNTLGKAEDKIQEEAAARADADSAIIGDAATGYNTLGKLEDKIQEEASTRGNADTTLQGNIDDVNEAIGTDGTTGTIKGRIAALEYDVNNAAGTVDTRIATAKSEVIGDAATEYNTLGKVEDQMQALDNNVDQRLDAQDAQIALLNGADVILVPDHTAVESPVANKIYREPEAVVDPASPTYYIDWMWDTTQTPPAWKEIAKYDFPGLDDEPTPGSQNLVKSGGVAASVVYDISAANSGATYADLAAALDGGNNIPESIRHGGMRIQFIKGTVQSSDNKYVQARCIAQNFTTDVTQWRSIAVESDFSNLNAQKIEQLPTVGAVLNGLGDKIYDFQFKIECEQNHTINQILEKGFAVGDKIALTLTGNVNTFDNGKLPIFDDADNYLFDAYINQITYYTFVNSTERIKFIKANQKVLLTTTLYGDVFVDLRDKIDRNKQKADSAYTTANQAFTTANAALPEAEYEKDLNGEIITLTPTESEGFIDENGDISTEYAGTIKVYTLNNYEKVFISLEGESRNYPHYAFYDSNTIDSENVVGNVGSTKDISGSEYIIDIPEGAAILAISYRTSTTTINYVKANIIGRIEAIEKTAESALQPPSAVNYEQVLRIKCDENKFVSNTIVTLGNGWSGNFAQGFVKTVTETSSKLEFDASNLFSNGDKLIICVDTVSNIRPHRVYVKNGQNAVIDLYHGGKGGKAAIVYEGGNIKLDVSADTSNTFFVTCQKIDPYGNEEVLATNANFIYSNINTLLHGFWVTKIGGNEVLRKAIDVSRIVAIGQYTLNDYLYGDRNVAIGTFAMPNVVKGYSNVSVGIDSIYPVEEANKCVAVGQNTIIGVKADRCVGVGYAALGGNNTTKTITDCVGVGNYAGSESTSECTHIGSFAGRNATGNRNTSVGCYANDDNGQEILGNENVAIGYKARVAVDANGISNAIAIGANAIATKNNQVVIGNSSTEEIILGNKKIIFNQDGSVTWEALS